MFPLGQRTRVLPTHCLYEVQKNTRYDPGQPILVRNVIEKFPLVKEFTASPLLESCLFFFFFCNSNPLGEWLVWLKMAGRRADL
jgi:hypothetical protein